MKNTLLLFSIIFLIHHSSLSQRYLKDSTIATPILGIEYGGTWSAGDLKDRYGYFNNVGFSAGYKLKSNFYVGLESNFIFGNKINIPNSQLFGALMDSKGNITDENGDIASVLTFSRGFHANIEVGYIIKSLGHNANSGVMIKLGGGYLNHRIRIETNEQVVPSLELDYRKGYDRLTTGFSSNQFVGYFFMSNNSFLNFYAGFYSQIGFTKNRRTIFFDQPDYEVPTNTRLDIMYGFKFGWMIPIYKRKTKDYYYN